MSDSNPDQYLLSLKWLSPAAKTRAGEMVATGGRAATRPGMKAPEGELDAFLFEVGRSRGRALMVVDSVARALDAAGDLAPARSEGAMETDRGRTYAERIEALVKLAREGREAREAAVSRDIMSLMEVRAADGTDVHVSLHTAPPGATGMEPVGHECRYENYQRMKAPAAHDASAWPLRFPEAGAGSAPERATHFAIVTARSGFSMVLSEGEIVPPIEITAGVTPVLMAVEGAGWLSGVAEAREGR